MALSVPAWTPPAGAPPGPGLRKPYPRSGDAARLLSWGSSVRAATLTQSLLSTLAIRAKASTADTFEVVHRPLGAAEALLLTISRPSEAQFIDMAKQVLAMVPQRGDVLEEIVAHAGLPWPFWGNPLGLDPQRQPCTFELLGCALQLSSAVYYRLKHEFGCPRPAAYSPLVLPVIATPPHSSYPSGHSCESFVVARILTALTGQEPSSTVGTYLQTVAARIAQLREVAGVHFPADSHAGRALGHTLADYFVALAAPSPTSTWAARDHVPTHAPFPGNDPLPPASGPVGTVHPDPLLQVLWDKAAKEWV